MRNNSALFTVSLIATMMLSAAGVGNAGPMKSIDQGVVRDREEPTSDSGWTRAYYIVDVNRRPAATPGAYEYMLDTYYDGSGDCLNLTAVATNTTNGLTYNWGTIYSCGSYEIIKHELFTPGVVWSVTLFDEHGGWSDAYYFSTW